MSRQPWRWAVLVVAILALAAGLLLASRWLARPFVDASQPWPGYGETADLGRGQTVGQTFVAQHAGLSGIDVFLHPHVNEPETLVLRLSRDPGSEDILLETERELIPGDREGFYRFSFPSLDDSHGAYYYATLELVDGNGSGTAAALADGTAYQDGAAYVAHQAVDAQTAFRLVYAPGKVALDLAKTVAGWLALLLTAGLLFIVPGWALLSWILPPGRLTWAEMLGLAGGLSLAVYALLLVWTDLVGLQLGALYAWLPTVGGLLALIWRYRSWRPRQGWQRLRIWRQSEAVWPDASLLFILALVFGLRFLVVRALQVPMWGDSYQHTMIAQLLVENGGLFDSWLPYVPLKSFTYHFGFHAAVAANIWLTGQASTDSVILIGQVLNGLAVLSLYPLALKISGRRWAGVMAILVAGLLSPMPMFYVNWGRYVQLAGQVVLPAAIWLAWEALDTPQRRVRVEALAGLAAAGLVLTHYRVTIYYVVLVPLLWFAATVRARKEGTSLAEPLWRVGVVAVTGLVLILPWAWRLFAGLLPTILGEFAQVKPATPTYHQAQVLSETTTYVPLALLVVAVPGLVVGLVRRRTAIFLVGIWTLFWFLAANPNWLGLPGAVTIRNFEGVINNFTVLISLYIPVSILIGYLFSTVIDLLPQRQAWLRPAAAGALILILSLMGGRNSLNTLETRYTLVTEPDLQAMNWIEEYTPKEARFLANSFFAYDGNVIVGSDAGWWLPLLAGRANTVPPITYGHEVAYKRDYIAQVNEFAHYVESNGLEKKDTVALLKQEGVSHVYIGQKGSSLSRDELEASEAYELVYHKDRVWIYRVR